MSNVKEILTKVNVLLKDNKSKIDELQKTSSEEASKEGEILLKTSGFEGTVEDFMTLVVESSHDEEIKKLADEWVSSMPLSKK